MLDCIVQKHAQVFMLWKAYISSSTTRSSNDEQKYGSLKSHKAVTQATDYGIPEESRSQMRQATTTLLPIMLLKLPIMLWSNAPEFL